MKQLIKFQVLLKKQTQINYLKDIFVKKSEIRKKILKIRSQKYDEKYLLDFNEIISVIKKQKIKNKIIGGYYSFNYEINVLDILNEFEKKNYKIALPKIKKNFKMDFYKWSAKSPLAINRYGIPEPISETKVYPDILFVPLVAYDTSLNRIGYGGGFYDRYIKDLKRYKKVLTIGLAYSFQEVKKIPINKYDIELDCIITEKKK